jgi:hypothetical protein
MSVSKRVRQVDPKLVNYMCATVHKLSDAALNEQFQISYNTWRKLIQGAPIRASLADRLEQRLKVLLVENPADNEAVLEPAL